MFTVVVTRKGGTSQTYEFDEELISIGRVQGNDIVLPLGNVSKRHAILEHKNNQFSVSDLDSTNGTYINGRRITETSRVWRGDRIYVGDYIMTLEGHKALEPAAENVEKLNGADSEAPSSGASPHPSRSSTDPARLSSAPPPVPASERMRRSKLKVKASTDKRRNELVLDIARETIPNVVQEFRPGEEEIAIVVETIIDHVTREIKRVDRAEVPVALDSGTAGRVRLLIDEFVEEYASRGKLRPTISKKALKGRAYRSIVDLGPLGAWLEDAEITMIRIEAPNRIKYLKNGGWVNAASGFSSREAQFEILKCLSAGQKCYRDEVPSMAWFHLEEGYLVFTSLGGDRPSDAFAWVDKTAATDPQAMRARLPSAVQERLQTAVDSRQRIAVVGAEEPARLSLISTIASLIPESVFSVSVEVIPPVFRGEARLVRLSAGARNETRSEPVIARVLAHAEELHPDWLLVTGGRATSLSHIFSFAAKRLGCVVELPLSAAQGLDTELYFALRAGGMTIDTAEAGRVLGAVFDLIVVVGRDRSGFPRVDRILEGVLTASGRWSPKVFWDRKKSN